MVKAWIDSVAVGQVQHINILTDLHLLLEPVDSMSIFGASNPSLVKISRRLGADWQIGDRKVNVDAVSSIAPMALTVAAGDRCW
ncbi:MAG: hypothetical protein KME17_23250 [Cyanosarcina radialis HA8281-LM2]|nr:hypothetical protein [Cyanosarcina radialis HA8281-LM2]